LTVFQLVFFSFLEYVQNYTACDIGRKLYPIEKSRYQSRTEGAEGARLLRPHQASPQGECTRLRWRRNCRKLDGAHQTSPITVTAVRVSEV
jgi:hypothetical protein